MACLVFRYRDIIAIFQCGHDFGWVKGRMEYMRDIKLLFITIYKR
jgi:hypothetical protein